jgi:uncharacterized membrane protein (UPF0136 family)
MKKRLLFLYRYLTASRHFRLWRSRWITAQTLMVLGISVAFMGTLSWAPPAAGSDSTPPARQSAGQFSMDVQVGLNMQSGMNLLQADTATPEAPPDPDAPPTRTPLPAEYLTNENQTNGLILASVVLVIIVVIGVLLFMPRPEER